VSNHRLTMKELERRFSDIVPGQDYQGSQAKYRFRCKVHGEYVHRASSYTGCPQCAIEKRRTSILRVCEQCGQENLVKPSYHKARVNQFQYCRKCRDSAFLKKAQTFAQAKGGECLSPKGLRNHRKLLWRCTRGHEWRATWHNVGLNGSWCPQCVAPRNQTYVRTMIELLFETDFPSDWPEWLRDANGELRELDGFNERLMLAFEYHGSQHRKQVPHFHRGGRTLKSQRSTDKWKRIRCNQRGIRLLVIWDREIPAMVTPEHIWQVETLIRSKLDALGCFASLQHPVSWDEFWAHWRSLTGEDKQLLEKCRSLGIEALSPVDKIGHRLFRCPKDGNQWWAYPSAITHIRSGGNGCRTCAGHRPVTVEDVRRAAKGQNATIQEPLPKIRNNRTKFHIFCKRGHAAYISYHMLDRGHWCGHADK